MNKLLVPDKSFVVPAGTNRIVAKARAAQEARGRTVELDIPEIIDLPVFPHRWLMLVSPVTIKKVGSIELTEQSQSDQHWTSGIGRVMAVGPSVYKGKQFVDKGLTPDDAPKVGEFVIYNAKSPLRFDYKGRTYVTINDDATLAGVRPEQVEDALINLKWTV